MFKALLYDEGIAVLHWGKIFLLQKKKIIDHHLTRPQSSSTTDDMAQGEKCYNRGQKTLGHLCNLTNYRCFTAEV